MMADFLIKEITELQIVGRWGTGSEPPTPGKVVGPCHLNAVRYAMYKDRTTRHALHLRQYSE